jgi:hypothetical protein
MFSSGYNFFFHCLLWFLLQVSPEGKRGVPKLPEMDSRAQLLLLLLVVAPWFHAL